MRKLLLVFALLGAGCGNEYKNTEHIVVVDEGTDHEQSFVINGAPGGCVNRGYFGGLPGQYSQYHYYWKDGDRTVCLPKNRCTVYWWNKDGERCHEDGKNMVH